MGTSNKTLFSKIIAGGNSRLPHSRFAAGSMFNDIDMYEHVLSLLSEERRNLLLEIGKRALDIDSMNDEIIKNGGELL